MYDRKKQNYESYENFQKKLEIVADFENWSETGSCDYFFLILLISLALRKDDNRSPRVNTT